MYPICIWVFWFDGQEICKNTKIFTIKQTIKSVASHRNLSSLVSSVVACPPSNPEVMGSIPTRNGILHFSSLAFNFYFFIFCLQYYSKWFQKHILCCISSLFPILSKKQPLYFCKIYQSSLWHSLKGLLNCWLSWSSYWFFTYYLLIV